MALEFSGNKKKYKDGKYSIVQLDLFKPTSKKFPDFDYTDIKTQLNEGESSGDDERFHDKEALELVRRLEAKYGNDKNGKRKKKKRFGCVDDFIDKTVGYDLEDAFIDDSEAYDELIPSTMDTAKGGFYVNRGKLEFRPKDNDVDDLSEEEEVDIKRPKKRPLIPTNSETFTTEDESMDDGEPVQGTLNASVDKNQASTSEQKETFVPRPRMAGAPPTKKHLADNSTVRLAQQIKKKRLGGAGLPPTLFRQKTIASAPSPKVDVADLQAPSHPQAEAISNTDETPEIEVIDVNPKATTATSEPSPVQSEELISSQQRSVPGVIGKTPFGSPKKGLPPMTETLSGLIANFKKATLPLAGPGQKKRLQKEHVAMVMNIEDQCTKDKFNSHEKSRVIESLANYVGIQRQSLYLRVKAMRDGGKKDDLPTSANGITQAANTSVTASTSKPASVKNVSNSSNSSPSPHATVAVAASTNSRLAVPLETKKTGSTASTTIPACKAPPRTLTDEVILIFNAVDATFKKLNVPADFINILKRMYINRNIELNLIMSLTQKMNEDPSTIAILVTQIRKQNELMNKAAPPRPSSNQNSSVRPIVKMKRPATSAPTIPAKVTASPSSSLTQLSQPSRSSSPVDHDKISEVVAHFKKMAQISLQNSRNEYTKKCKMQLAAGRAVGDTKKTLIWGERLLCALREFAEVVWKISPNDRINTTVLCLTKNVDIFENFLTLGDLVQKAVELYPVINPIIGSKELNAALTAHSARPLSQNQTTNMNSTTVDDDIQLAEAHNSPSTSKAPSTPVGQETPSETSTSVQKLPLLNTPTTSKPSTSNQLNMSSKGSKSAIPQDVNGAMMQAMAKVCGLSPANLVTALANPQTAAMLQMHMMSNPASVAAIQKSMIESMSASSVKSSVSDEAERKRKEEEMKKIEYEKRKTEEERKKLAEKKKLELAEAKQRAIDEKKKQKEEEKRRKEEEKIKKAEEERLQRLREEEEKERKREELLQLKLKEEAEQRKREEERQRELENMRIKEEDEAALREHERQQTLLAEEEERALTALEDDLLDPDEKEESIREREEAEKADRLRMEEQLKKVHALREATIKQQPLSPSSISNSPMRPPSLKGSSSGQNCANSSPHYSNFGEVPRSPAHQNAFQRSPSISHASNIQMGHGSFVGHVQENQPMISQSPHAIPSSPLRAGFPSPAGSHHSVGIHQNDLSMGSPFSQLSSGPSPMTGHPGSQTGQSPVETGRSSQSHIVNPVPDCSTSSSMGYHGQSPSGNISFHGMSSQSPMMQHSMANAMGYGQQNEMNQNSQLWAQNNQSQYDSSQMQHQQMMQQKHFQEQQIQKQRMIEEQRMHQQRLLEEQQRQMQMQREHEEKQRQMQREHEEKQRQIAQREEQRRQNLLEEQRKLQQQQNQKLQQQRLLEEQRQQLQQQRLLEEQRRQMQMQQQQRLIEEQQRQKAQQQMMQQQQFQGQMGAQMHALNQQQIQMAQQQQPQMPNHQLQQQFFNGMQQQPQGNNYQNGHYPNGSGYY